MIERKRAKIDGTSQSNSRWIMVLEKNKLRYTIW
jgi:hypothetical protein